VRWPFAELLGIRAKSVGDGRARFELEVEAKHLNPNGTVHGGVIYSLANQADRRAGGQGLRRR
jgi:acyl-CoA thioesterase